MFIKLFGLVSLTLLIASCATSRPPVGEPNNDQTQEIKSGIDVYAKLVHSKNGYEFTSICQQNEMGNRCPTHINNPWASYIKLNDLTPAFSTKGLVCDTVFFISHSVGYHRNNKPMKRRSCSPAPYWDKSIAFGEFLQYIFVIPAIGLYYGEEVYLNYDKLNAALLEADSKLDRQKLFSKLEADNERRLAQVENEKQQRERMKAKERQLEQDKRDMAMRAFKSSSTMPKTIGDKVCSADNVFGYVERMKGDKIQIRKVGRVQSQPHYFFTNRNGRFSYLKDDRIIWDVTSKWGQCLFEQ